MENSVEVGYEDSSKNYDYEVELPDWEFDGLVKIMAEKHNIKYEFPKKIVFYATKDAIRYKIIRSNDGSFLQ